MGSKTIDTILEFLNQVEVYEILSGVEAGIYNILRNEIIELFKNNDKDSLFEIVSLFDRLYIDYLEKKSYFDKTLIINLRNKILAAYIEKIENAPLEED